MKFKPFTLLTCLFVLTQLNAQPNFYYELNIKPVVIPNFPGLHSYAYAQHQGKWLIIGGRKDGIHARQPFNAFPAAQNNTDIYVVDVENKQFWSSSVNVLPTNIKEQLQSTNMNYCQEKDSLYIIGGYGFSASANDHITYPYLTAVNVSGLMNAIINNQSIVSFFRQIQDQNFAVTGGHLKQLKDDYYLIGGHQFNGRYNPMGNPTYTQTYTNQIRKFKIHNGLSLSYSAFSATTDPVHLRRRDYNLLPQIFANGEEGFTISSGVFQINADLPFLYPVDIKANSYNPITSFNQYLSHYHCGVAHFYDSLKNNMHSIFFGGMSQYYYQNGTLIQDNQVPFVKTISRLSRDSMGNFSEHLMPIEMPALKGSSAEFIPNLKLSHFDSKIIKLSPINQTEFLIGHLVGGINSSAINPFSNNQTSSTNADPTIYEIWLKKNTNAVDNHSINGNNPYDFVLYPIPFKDQFKIQFNLKNNTSVSYFVCNSLGQIIKSSENTDFKNGEHFIDVSLPENAQPLFITVVFDNKFYVHKKIMNY